VADRGFTVVISVATLSTLRRLLFEQQFARTAGSLHDRLHACPEELAFSEFEDAVDGVAGVVASLRSAG
jgi:hypothetical protein